MRGVAQKETFLINDNGHLNQRMQQYAHHNRKVTTLQVANQQPEQPGPGQYEAIVSDFDKNSPTCLVAKGGPGPVINPVSVLQAVSPGRAAAAASNPSLQKMSVPSIPSRFLTPVIDAGSQDHDDTQDICKMSRLVDDPSKVGPGTYLVNEE